MFLHRSDLGISENFVEKYSSAVFLMPNLPSVEPNLINALGISRHNLILRIFGIRHAKILRSHKYFDG